MIIRLKTVYLHFQIATELVSTLAITLCYKHWGLPSQRRFDSVNMKRSPGRVPQTIIPVLRPSNLINVTNPL